MKIALINENSQAAKTALIEATLRKVVEPMGHEVVNYGMYAADDAAQEAEAHAADDKKKQELISARNQADGLIYGTEKSINDIVDKLDAALKSDIAGKIASLKPLMEGEDVEAIKKATEELAQASHKLAEQLYSQAQGQQPGADAAAGAQPGAGAAGGKKADDDVIDADFTYSK